ncbi:MAG: glycosyltransferase [Clostridiaceae bacterium]|nr:glycosyltransferase [Clostridiaceae bacterium]
MDYSFVIPCYNSSQTILSVVNDIHTVMSEKKTEYEIILVNDCSPDNLKDVIKDLVYNDHRIKVINLKRNQGKHVALLVGYRASEGDIVTILDDDGQCPITRFWDLIKPLAEGYDVSIAKYPKKKQSFLKNIGSKISILMQLMLLGRSKKIKFSNFIAMKKDAVEEISEYPGHRPFINKLIIDLHRPIANVDMEELPRMAGRSNYNLKKSWELFADGVMSSIGIIRVFQILGVFLMLMSVLCFIVLLILTKFYKISLLIISIISLMIFFGGMNFLALGIVGEYAGRAYLQTRSNQNKIKISDTYNLSPQAMRRIGLVTDDSER